MTPSGVKVAFLRYCYNLTTCAGAHVVIFYMLISEIRLNTEIRVFHSISMFFFQLNKMIFYTSVKIYLFIGTGGGGVHAGISYQNLTGCLITAFKKIFRDSMLFFPLQVLCR